MYSVLNPSSNFQAFLELIALFRRRGRLIYELTKREIGERYTGQVFGVLWAIGHPLLLTFVYIFIFGFVFRARTGGTIDMPLDYTAYILSGIIPWLMFQEALAKASTVIIANANIVKQVIFPLEVLPVKSVLATIVTEVIFLFLLAIYTLITNGAIPWTYVFLPVLILFQTLGMIGISYLFSSIGVYFRDLKDFVQIFLSIAFFILPILYLPESIPAAVRPILYLNPISYMIWCFQDILYFGHFAHPWAWAIFLFGSVFIFIFGFRVFRRLKTMFGNAL
ncbi:MAG TPA: ABC transporter permease [Anaerolineales bacterium]|nr:ABC transporter permease [Anaerolineales bacterium]